MLVALQGRLHFVVRDTERDYLGATAIPGSFVNDRMLHRPMHGS